MLTWKNNYFRNLFLETELILQYNLRSEWKDIADLNDKQSILEFPLSNCM